MRDARICTQLIERTRAMLKATPWLPVDSHTAVQPLIIGANDATLKIAADARSRRPLGAGHPSADGAERHLAPAHFAVGRAFATRISIDSKRACNTVETTLA